MNEDDFSIYTPEKESLPERLFEIPDPPKILRARGTLPSQNVRFLSVVGSRKYSSYGKNACESLIAGLSGSDVVIVSGLALGIDAIAHRSALDARLKTLAIPGSGLHDNVLYPRTNFPLARDILNSGSALLSPFSDNWKPRLESFPERNRIMAGISHATLVIEANERSGTLITARLALEYNRDVMAVPGSIFSEASTGSNKLLRQGAFPVTSSEDILDILGIEKESTNDSLLLENLSNEERKVLKSLSEPISKDDLLEILDLPIQDANIVLSGMEIKGLISESFGKLYRKV